MKTIVENLLEKMAVGPTLFAYKKKDGELRPAIGTLNSAQIPVELTPKTPAKKNENNVVYFDLQRKKWRTCKAINIIKIEA